MEKKGAEKQNGNHAEILPQTQGVYLFHLSLSNAVMDVKAKMPWLLTVYIKVKSVKEPRNLLTGILSELTAID
jgi:hypothetical protein